METGKKRRILFVDDEDLLLKGLQRMLRSMRKEWDMCFVDNGRAALDLIRKEPFDAVITDMQMPGMSGIQLLETVMNDYPDIVRIILSGQLDQEGKSVKRPSIAAWPMKISRNWFRASNRFPACRHCILKSWKNCSRPIRPLKKLVKSSPKMWG